MRAIIERLVDVLYKKDKGKLMEAIMSRCPNSIGLEDVGCNRNYGDDYDDDGDRACDRCWIVALEESEYADFIKF